MTNVRNSIVTRFAALLLVPAALMVAQAALAQTEPPPRPGPPVQGDIVTVGLGIGVTTDYAGARDYRIIPGGILLGTVAGHDFRLNGPQFFIDAIPNDPRRRVDIELGPVAGVSFNRTGEVSDSRIAALGELDAAIELGVRGGAGVRGLLNRTDKLALAVTGIWDVAGAHRSYVISPSVEYSTLAGRRTFMRLALTTEIVGKRWATYNFGIDAAGAAASGLATHDPDGGLASIGGNALVTYSLSGERTGWSVFGIASYKRLLGDIADSPIVRDTGSPRQLFAAFGVGYTF